MGQLSGTASIEIEASIAEVWAMIEDVASAPSWQGGLESMTPLERDDQGRPVLCETESDAKVRNIKSHVRFTYAAPSRLDWTQVKGDLKSLDGSWLLEDLGNDRTRATYTLEGDPGRVLGMLVRGPVEGTIRERLVHTRPTELKRRVEQPLDE